MSGSGKIKLALEKKPATVVVAGVGSRFDFFDSLGLLIMEAAEKALAAEFGEKIIFIDAGDAPENHTSRIKRAAPTQIIILDSADIGLAPFSLGLVPAEKIAGLKFSGHSLPLSLVCKYLKAETGADIFIIGVQIPAQKIDEKSAGALIDGASAQFIELLTSIFSA